MNHALPVSGGNRTAIEAEGVFNGSDLVGEALPLEITEIDDRKFTFVWYFRSGVDRLSLAVDGEPAGVIEALDTRTPRLLCDKSREVWFAERNRAARVVAAAHLQWSHRGEIVADRALAQGGRS